MDSTQGKLTVFFEDPFWVGIFERIEHGKLSASKVIFGAEPKDYEVWEYVLKNYEACMKTIQNNQFEADEIRLQ
jgi:hypothetical protein